MTTTHTAIDHLDIPTFRARILADHYGFLSARDVARLADHPEGRLTALLIRAGSCRLTCPAQDVTHLERCLIAGGDYIRDVSFPAERS